MRAVTLGIAAFGFAASSSAAPDAPYRHGLPSWSDEQHKVLLLEDVLIDPRVTEATTPDLLRSLGIDVPPGAHAAILSIGDLSSGGELAVFIDGAPSGGRIGLITLAQAPMAFVPQEVSDPEGDVLGTMETTATLTSGYIVSDAQVKPILCAVVSMVARPSTDAGHAATVTQVWAFGEVVDATIATEFVRRFAESSSVEAMAQHGGGITPPTPPPPAMLPPCCTCSCQHAASIGHRSCAAAFNTCINAALALHAAAVTACTFLCGLLGPFSPGCLLVCLATAVAVVVESMAGCITALVACHSAVIGSHALCVLSCWMSGQWP